ncbi:MAG: glycosyltransferase family 4 protein [Acidobacteriia bacterium]|nr:glycosyltransferase family 4 protein [Terriglobia bacterium]
MEQIERLAKQPGWEIHLYSQHVEQVAGVCLDSSPDACSPSGARIIWHRIPDLPGPHLLRYLWWFAANHFYRWRDRRSERVRPDLVYSPGINCADADVIAVHIVFREFYRQVRGELRLRKLPLRSWPLTLHRKLYYLLIMGLEGWIYRNSRIRLAAVSHLAARQLAKHFQRGDVAVIPNAVDAGKFHPLACEQARSSARNRLGLETADFVLLLIGNDWKKKGLDVLLQALALCRNLPLRLLVVGKDDRRGYEEFLRQLGLAERVRFLEPSPDVVQFYAAADAYVGPSREDAYGLPILEAMACGLPVIASARAGASEIIADGKNGLILRNPEDSRELAEHLRRLASDKNLCARLGEAAAATAREHTWDRNAAETWEFLRKAAERKKSAGQGKDCA